MTRLEIHPYNKNWPLEFEEMASKLKMIWNDELIEIHHIGSTSIPNMSAKPIIDILIVVNTEEKIPNYDLEMIALGFQCRGECLDDLGTKGRYYYCKDTFGLRTHQVHIMAIGHPEIQEKINFKNYLIRHPEDAARYQQLKESIIHEVKGIKDYIARKNSLIKELTKKANEWSLKVSFIDPLQLLQIKNYIHVKTTIPQICDLIFVFGSSYSEAAHCAIRLNQQTSAKYIILTGGYNPKVGNTEADMFYKILLEAGVANDKILIERNSKNTVENIKFAMENFSSTINWHTVKSILVVCKQYHSRRALMTLKKQLPHEVKLYCCTYLEMDQILQEKIWREYIKIPRYTLQGNLFPIFPKNDYYV